MTGQERGTSNAELGEVARLLSYIVLLAVSGVLLAEAFAIPSTRFEVLGAGAFPKVVHVALIALLLSAIAGSVRRLPADAYGRFAHRIAGWARARRLVFALFACLGLYLYAMPRIGFTISTFAFLVVLQAVFAPWTRRNLVIGLVLALCFSAGLNWVFAEVFNVFLPRGR